MLNKWDDAIAPSICQYFLILLCFILSPFLFYLSDIILLIFISLFILLVFFTLKVFSVRNERNRVYKIIKNRIQKKGYSREVFDYKFSTVCQLTQAIYIASRYRMYNDILYFIKSRKNKKISFIHEDEELEKKLNKLDFSKISDGEIIHEFKK